MRQSIEFRMHDTPLFHYSSSERPSKGFLKAIQGLFDVKEWFCCR
jgi:hypothetical protein